MSFRYSSCFSLSSPNMRSFSTPEKPMMAFRGVRSSRLLFQGLGQRALQLAIGNSRCVVALGILEENTAGEAETWRAPDSLSGTGDNKADSPKRHRRPFQTWARISDAMPVP